MLHTHWLATGALLLVLGAGAQAQTSLDPSLLARASGTAGAPGGSGSYSSNPYQRDDGTAEDAIGLAVDGTLVWIHAFDATYGWDMITKVSVAFGNPPPGASPPAGTPVQVFVWEDPNDDGDPIDGVLVGSASGVIASPDTNTLVDFAVPPCAVSGKFLVGVAVAHVAGQFPAAYDHGGWNYGEAWITGELAPNTYNGQNPVGSIGYADVAQLGGGFTPGRWLLRAEGSLAPDTAYCTAKLNSLGCLPSVSSQGAASATANSGHLVQSVLNRNQKSGLLFYSVHGRANTPFQGGTLCVAPPVRRTPVLFSGGTPLPVQDCTGVYAIDTNAFAQGLLGGTPSPALQVLGTVVDCQFWGRDPGFAAPNDTSLSDALEFVVGP